MRYFLNFANYALFWYYFSGNLVYLVALIIALKTSAAHQRGIESFRLRWITESPLAPPITLLAPAHNEEKSIRVSLRNLLELDYPELEVIVINDGSRDHTFEELRDEFKLRPVRLVYMQQVPSAPIRGLYRSDLDP